MSQPTFDRKYLQLAAVLLVGLAMLRLAFVMIYGDSETSKILPTLVHRVTTKFTAEIKGPEGDKIRLHFPEIPLNLEADFNDGKLDLAVDLKMPKKPSQLRCQVLKEGVVIAQSKLLAIEDRELQDLGIVRVRKIK